MTEKPMPSFPPAIPVAFLPPRPSSWAAFPASIAGGIATVIPAPNSEFVLLDSGANIECKPVHLAHYAVMGSIYSREILGRQKPRVGILSIGTEETKGNELTLEAFKLCKQLDINFIGNVEGLRLFQKPRGCGRLRWLCRQHRFEDL